jgi:S1-C subfamily serine protease
VGPHDDDLDEGAGPLPDPTLRAWRHPSEIAAAAAMAAREAGGGAPARRLAPSSVLVGVTLGVALTLGAVAAVSLLRAGPAEPGFPLRSGDAARGGNPAARAATASSPTPTPTQRTSAPTTAVTTTVALPPLVPVGDEVAAAEQATIPAGAVVAVLAGADEHPRCTGVVVDGYVVTSASAVGVTPAVTLVVDGASYPGTVVARDRFTDIAVIQPDPGAPLVELPGAGALAPDAAVALVATDGQPEPITVVGRVTGVGGSASARDGHGLLGLMSTTARFPEGGAGALLVTPQGSLAGMVVDGVDHVALAVPEPTLRQVTRSLVATGYPVASWIGVSAMQNDHGVQLHAVEPDGPAFAAGLRRGDLVLSVAGSPVKGVAELIGAIRAHQPGDVLVVSVLREGATVEVEVPVGTRGAHPSSDQRAAG